VAATSQGGSQAAASGWPALSRSSSSMAGASQSRVGKAAAASSRSAFRCRRGRPHTRRHCPRRALGTRPTPCQSPVFLRVTESARARTLKGM
jgi:hypothetical protein